MKKNINSENSSITILSGGVTPKQVTETSKFAGKHKAFTLAETLITLVILGIIAAITIPALVRNHVENANRTKLKKAMTVYDTALSKIIIENGIKSNDGLITYAGNEENNCQGSAPYFKSTKYLKVWSSYSSNKDGTLANISFSIP